MKKNYLAAALVSVAALTAITFTGCNPDPEVSDAIKKINIAGSSSIFISKGPLSARSAFRDADDDFYDIPPYEAPVLCKVMPDGTVSEVEYYDTYGNKISLAEKEPALIKTVSDDYILISYDQSPGGHGRDYSYLVRKSDGAAFDCTVLGIPEEPVYGFKNEPFSRLDSSNNLYMLARVFGEDTKLIKVDLNGINTLKAIKVADVSMTYNVDNNQNLYYWDYDFNHIFRRYDQKKEKYRRPIIYTSRTFSADWTGLDGFHYVMSDGDDFGYQKMCKVTFDENDRPVFTECFKTDDCLDIDSDDCFIMRSSDRITLFRDSNNVIFEADNLKHEPRIVQYKDLEMKTISNVKEAGGFYYISGEDGDGKSFFVKVNPVDDSWVDLVARGTFDGSDYAVSSDGTITFKTETESGNSQLFTVTSRETGPRALTEEIPKVTYLERVN